MVSRKEIVEKIKKLMDKTENIRNIGIVAHIDHGKTTLSDNLLAGSGIISSELAGKMLFMDYDEEEQARGITINAANVSILFNHKETSIDYLINLIDTPGHVDFGGDVTRAMRAVDGCIVVVDAVEGMMPQTETVLKQALKENVKPVLFVNKVDRLINELKIDKKDMQYRLAKVIEEVNKFIRNIQKEKYESGWKINPADGSVAFGSALYKWAISIPMLEKTGIGFNEVYDYCVSGKMRELAEKSPLYNIVFDMVVKHLPNPLVSQKRRIPTIWHGDLDSEIGRSMLNCEKNGPIIFMVTKIVPDPHAGEVATGRLFSGTLKRGMELYISNVNRTNKAQQVGIYMGPDRVEVEEIPAGNIIAVTGLKDAIVGSTVSTVEDIVPFEEIRHVSEPVVTVAVEAKNMKDLPRLIEVLREVSKEDPTVQVQIDEESGEHLISGMGELHLEVIGHKIERDKKVPIITSEPIVVYRESIISKGGPTEGVSPNRHNRFYMEVEPLSESVVELLKSGAFSMKLPELERRKLLMDAGFNTDEAKAVVDEYKNNLLLNMTKGIQYLPETMELIIEGFREVMSGGPLAKEPCQGIKVRLIDVKLHEDSIHRGPAQVIPAVRNAIYSAILSDTPVILEPIQRIYISAPQDYMGEIIKELQGRRGQIIDIQTEKGDIVVKGTAPVSELFGFAGAIRSATEGRALWNSENIGFQVLPPSLRNDVIMDIRRRKGMKEKMPEISDYV